MKVRFAISPGRTAFDPASFTRFVVGLEERRFDTVWLSDIPLSDGIEPVLGLSIAAAHTTTLKLGANVVPIGRSPLQLAKQLAQLDRLSGGRVLLTMVPGVGTPAERSALGVAAGTAGAVGAELERMIAELRRLWTEGPARPLQQPLELWLGGRGPKALERAGRIGDGWLGAALSPAEAKEAKASIDASAQAAGRQVDPEHFGMSIAVARHDPGDAAFEAARRRRPDVDPRLLMPVGTDALRRRVEQYVAAGCSKFVLHPVPGSEDDLDWLADTVLPLQS